MVTYMVDRKHPNIVYIYADDLGKGTLSCYGQKLFETPNIDRIAGEGILFKRAYANAFCAPARASLICGIHDAHAGRWTYSPGNIYKKISTGELTFNEVCEVIQHTGIQQYETRNFLAGILKDKGYVTGEIGKLEWGFATGPKEMKTHGWDYHYGYYDHIRCHGFYPPFLFENGKKVDIPGNKDPNCGRGPYELPPEGNLNPDMSDRKVYSQDLFDDKIKSFIHQHQEETFFLFHPSQLPHGPVFYPNYHPHIAHHPDLLPLEKEYVSMILRLDDTVGMILDELESLGIMDNTLIIFASDNGHTNKYYEIKGRTQTELSRDGRPLNQKDFPFRTSTFGDVFNGNDGLAGLKFSSWDGGNRICFMAKWDGVIEPGTISHQLISNYDTCATFADIVGRGQLTESDGRSYLPILKGEKEEEIHEYVIFASSTGPSIVTAEGWKLRLYIDSELFEEGTMSSLNLSIDRRVDKQLYHVLEDEAETNNLADQYPEKVHELMWILLKECDGNFYNGTPNAHHVKYPIDVPDWARICQGEI